MTSFFRYNTPRAATVVATTDVVLYSIDRQTFHSLLENETRKKRKIYAEFLSSVPLLANLDSYERLRIADALTTESFNDGTVIVKEGDAGDRFYLILEGQVKITKQGVEQSNSPLDPWQYFGEVALLSDDKRQATCTAVGAVKVEGKKNAFAFCFVVRVCMCVCMCVLFLCCMLFCFVLFFLFFCFVLFFFLFFKKIHFLSAL